MTQVGASGVGCDSSVALARAFLALVNAAEAASVHSRMSEGRPWFLSREVSGERIEAQCGIKRR